MTDFRRFPDGNTRQLIDYNRFVSLTGNKVFICLDQGVMEIARYLLNSRGSWRTTYVKEYVGTIGYEMPTLAEFQLVEQAIAEANEDMSSCSELVEALNGIALAIGENVAPGASSSSGCGCVTSGDTDVTDVNDIDSQDVPTGASYPPGFDSRVEYDGYRCKAAYWIVRNYIQTLRNWAGLFGMVGGLTVAVIAGLLLLTVPPIGLTLIMAALGLLVGIDIGLLAELNNIADGLEEEEDSLACQIYNAADSGSAAQIIRDAAIVVIDDLALAASATFKQITDNLISNSQADILITRDPVIDALPEEDCSTCAGPCGFQLYDPLSVGDAAGSYTIVGNHVTIEPTFQAGRWAVGFQFSATGNPNACAIIDNIVVTDASHTFYDDNWVECGSEAGLIPVTSGDFTELEGECIHAILFQADPNDNPNPGTQPVIEFDIIECCLPE